MLSQIKQLVADKKGNAAAILGGIMVMIIGFATLTIGNYIIYAIASSLPTIAGTYASAYTNTTNSVMGYVTTVLPLFGLALMVLGFAIILFTLRSSMGERSE
jgi:hypothetical protein